MPSEAIWSDTHDPGISLFRGFKGTDKPNAFIRLIDDGDAPNRVDPLLYIRDADAGLAPSIRVTKAGTILEAGPTSGTTTFSLTSTGAISGVEMSATRLSVGGLTGNPNYDNSPWNDPITVIGSGETDRNLAVFRGRSSVNTTGYYHAVITDTCAFVTNGWIGADGASNIPGQMATLASFMVGANSDIGPTIPNTAVFVSFANADDLDQFQFWAKVGGTLDAGPRLRVRHLGGLTWTDGTGYTGVTLDRTDTGVLGTNGAIEFTEIGADPAAGTNAVRLYSKDVAGVSRLFARLSNGTVVSLTP